MRILIVANQVPMPDEQRVMRINTLNSLLVKRGHDVTILTSIFNHYDKKKRPIDSKYSDFNVVLVKERGYKKNISIRRLLSQKDFARNAKKWFKQHHQDFDCVFAVVPTHEAVYKIGKICKKYSIPLLEDVEDLWPEAMEMVLGKNFLSKLILSPMKRLVNKTYKLANSFTAVSKAYLNRALSVNPTAANNTVVYLGVDSVAFEEGKKIYSSHFTKHADEFWVCYIGTIGASYDLKTLVSAISDVHSKGFKKIKCKIIGRGPEEEELKRFVKANKVDVDFVEFMEYKKLAGYLSNCDLMVNPIKASSAASVINKVGDYFASGKPILNSCIHPEMISLIIETNSGFNYEPENILQLSNLILEEYKNDTLRNLQCNNSYLVYKNMFDRNQTYLAIINQLENLSIK